MKQKHLLLLILIVIIAGFLRLYQIRTTPPGLYPDEAMNGNNALQTLRTSDWKIFYPENNGREGLFINIQALFLKFFGADSPSQISPGEIWEGKPWALRLPSAIFGILTVLGMFFLGKELFESTTSFSPKPRSQPGLVSDPQSDQAGEDKRVNRWNERSGLRKNEIAALLSAFFLATSFWHINFSRIGFRAIMAPFFLVWAIYFLLKAFHSKSFTSYKLQATSSGLLYGLGFHTYIAYRVTPLIVLFIIFYFWKQSANNSSWRKKILLSTCYFLLAIFIAVLPLGIYFLTHQADFLGRTSQISVFSSETPFKDLGMNAIKTLGMFNFRGDENWRHNYSGRPELFWPVGILFLIGIILAIKNIIQNSKFSAEGGSASSGKNQNDADKIEHPRQSRDNPKLRNEMKGESTFPFFVLFLWLVLAILPVVVSNEGMPHALRSILMIPPVFIFAGVAGVWLYETISTKLKDNAKIQKIFPVACCLLLVAFVFEAYNTYFVLWAKNSNTYGAFSADYAELGRKLNELPPNIPKYIVVKANGTLVNGIPMPTQTVMFITNTFSTENQRAKNIYYVLPDQENNIPQNSLKFYLN